MSTNQAITWLLSPGVGWFKSASAESAGIKGIKADLLETSGLLLQWEEEDDVRSPSPTDVSTCPALWVWLSHANRCSPSTQTMTLVISGAPTQQLHRRSAAAA